MKRPIMILAAVALLTLLTAIPALAQAPVACESTYTIAPGDWLSKVAAKEYGDPLAYFPIFSATNSQAVADKTFDFIDDPNRIEVDWKLCIPPAPIPPAGLSAKELANATYKSEFAAGGQATLQGGKFSEPAAPGSAMKNMVSLTNAIAYGDLDGVPSAAVILLESSGGSGSFYTLHVVQAQDGKPADIAGTLLGDRVNVTSLYIQDGKIVVGMTTQGPDEPMCCPTQRVLNTYVLKGETLEQVSSQVVGSTGP